MQDSKSVPHIVIVGGGAGGLELATNLGKKLGAINKATITLVDSSLTHIWKPLLHEVAAGTLNCHEDEVNYFAQASKNSFEFHQGKMIDVDHTNKKIILDNLYNFDKELMVSNRSINYDFLVIAVGSQSNDFKTEGAKENCIFLDSRIQAERFQKKFIETYLHARANSLQSNEVKKMNITIIGAGATGVELAAELNYVTQKLMNYCLSNIHPDNVKISIIEASNRILAALPNSVSNEAQKELEKMGIQILLSTKVIKVEENTVHFEGGATLESDLTVWSAGIKAPDFLKNIIHLETNHINQIKIKSTLQTTKDDNIFAIGDCSSYISAPDQKPLPPRAQVASQQASFLAKSLIDKIVYNKPFQSFIFIDKGSLISLGKNHTVGHIYQKYNVHGVMARIMYILLYRFHQFTLHGLRNTILLIFKNKINKISRPKLKLH